MTARSFQRRAFFFVAILSAALFFGCSSIPSHSSDAPATWLEGKNLPLTVNFQEGKKLDAVQRVTLAYSINDGEEKLLDMERVLGKASVTIPGSDLVPGNLRWILLVDTGKKVEKTKPRSFRVISRAEGLEIARRELSAAVDWDPLLTVPEFLDAEFDLAIRGGSPQAAARFFVRKRGLSWELRPGFLTDGRTSLVLTKEELASGYDSLYVEVEDEHPDFGSVTASFPSGGASAPYSLTVLSEAQTREALSRDLAASIIHKAEKEGSVYYDFPLSFAYKPSSVLLRSLIVGQPSALVSALLPGAASWTRIESAAAGDGSWKASIPASALRGGSLYYALEMAVSVKGLGPFSSLWPSGGRDKPAMATILDAPKSRERMEAELREGFSIEIPKETSILEDQEIKAKFRLDDDSWLARKSSDDLVAIFARLRRSGTLELRQRGFSKDHEGWYLALSASDLASGVDGFAVDISIDSRTAAGKVTATLPEGWNAAYSLNVLSRSELAARKASSFVSSINTRFSAPRGLTEGRAATISIPFDQDCRTAVIGYYRPGTKTLVTRPLARSSSGWQASLPAEDMVAGNLVYWFRFEVEDSALGIISFSYPQGGEAAPLRATVTAAAALTP